MTQISNHSPRGFGRAELAFAVFALLTAAVVTAQVTRPTYTDAFYHFNAATRVARGEGLTDPYLWTYIGAPDSLPAPSHLYWMPLTSLTAALGMVLTGQPGNHTAAQWPFALMVAATAGIAYALGWRLGGSRRHAWLAGWLTLFSGFFVRYWGAIDTFAPFALIGSVCLLALGTGLARLETRRRAWPLLALAGAFAGLAHLTRADGLLLLLVGGVALFWPGQRDDWRRRLPLALTFVLAYAIVMLAWWLRNLALVGTPLPVGGAQGIWFTDYNELFNYPADANTARLFADGVGLFLATRWEAFVNNLATFIAVEGLIVLTPLMLVGLWRWKRLPLLRGFWLYALALHVVMTLVFPFPGYRGGLLHSAAALVPVWAALGAVGLDDIVNWAARRRRWRAGTARLVFGVALAAYALALSVMIGARASAPVDTPARYAALQAALPPDARVMVNDPAQLYYFTGLGGVVLPNEAPDTIRDIARRYQVGYLLLEGEAATPPPLWPLYGAVPDWLTPVTLELEGARLYVIELESKTNDPVETDGVAR